MISTTTFAAIAFGAMLSTGAVAVPAWQTDYSQAMAKAAAQQKPLAVFFARGEAGYAKIVGGEVPMEAAQVLTKSYVCVYVDTDTTAGQSLASAFSLSKGLIISNKGGELQALRHTGNMSPTDLTGYLTRYSEVKVISTTEKVGEASTVAAASGAVFSSCSNGRCGLTSSSPVYAPVSSQAHPTFSSCPNGQCGAVRGSTIYQPAYTSFPSVSSCPNGRCPNAR